MKGKVASVHTVKAMGQVYLWPHTFLTLAVDAALPQGKESQHLFSRRLGGHQRWSAHFIEEKKPCLPARNQTTNLHSFRP
jgi:hypothetical protein